MIRKSIAFSPPIFLLPDDKRKCLCIATYVMVQCIIMFVASITVLQCLWSPGRASFDYYKLASIMYLYDKKACGYSLASKSVANLQLSNDTRGLNVLPIKRMPAIVTVSTRLSAKTRTYVKLSLAFHGIWFLLAVALRIFIKNTQNPHIHKFVLTCFFYYCIFIILFDLSMAIVYVAHIKQCLTKGMIIRYSGWSVLLELENAEDFAGWLPMLASACWLRGVLIFALNVYCSRIIRHIRNKIQKIEFRERYYREGSVPIPEPRHEREMEKNVLYYRPGELQPYVKNDFSGPRMF